MGTLEFSYMCAVQALTRISTVVWDLSAPLYFLPSFLGSLLCYYGSLRLSSDSSHLKNCSFLPLLPLPIQSRLKVPSGEKSYKHKFYPVRVSFIYGLTPLQCLPATDHSLVLSDSCFCNLFRVYNCHLMNGLSIYYSTVTRVSRINLAPFVCVFLSLVYLISLKTLIIANIKSLQCIFSNPFIQYYASSFMNQPPTAIVIAFLVQLTTFLYFIECSLYLLASLQPSPL